MSTTSESALRGPGCSSQYIPERNGDDITRHIRGKDGGKEHGVSGHDTLEHGREEDGQQPDGFIGKLEQEHGEESYRGHKPHNGKHSKGNIGAGDYADDKGVPDRKARY